MAYKTISLNEIKKEYNEFVETQIVKEDFLDSNYKKIRESFKSKYLDLKDQCLSTYALDLEYGIFIYKYFNEIETKDFTPIYESGYDFWRYLSVCVIPDVIQDRFGINAVNHFYKKATAIYPFTLYWYIKLSWQGNEEKTKAILKDFTSDEILQLVDRPSSIGVNLELYRNIMYKYSLVPKKDRIRTYNGRTTTKFRDILKKNTSKLMVIRPEIYEGGIEKYVDMLFE